MNEINALWRFGIAALLTAAMTTLGQPSRTQISSSLEIPRLVDLVSEQLNISIEYDPAALRGTTTIRGADDLTDATIMGTLADVLAARGFAIVQSGRSGMLMIVRTAEVGNFASDQGEIGFRSVTRELEQLDPAKAIEAIKPLLSRAGAAAALGESGLLLITEEPARLARIDALLDRLDAAQEPIRVRQLTPTNMTAQRLAALVSDVVSRREGLTNDELNGTLSASDGGRLVLVAPESDVEAWLGLIRELDTVDPVELRWYRADGYALADVAEMIESVLGSEEEQGLRIVQDALTGSMAVYATTEQHEQVAGLIGRLAESAAESPRVVRAFPLKNRDVTELLSVLEGLIDAGALAPGGSADVVASTPDAASGSLLSGQGATTETSASAELGLTADESTNSLIAVGPARLLAQLGDLVEQLDTRQPQVMIEALLVSLSDGESLDFGVELERLEVSGGTFFKLSSLFGLSSGTGGGITDVGRSVEDGTGFTGLVLDPGEFSVVVRALQTISDGKGIRRPKLLVNNNESASFDSINEQPFTSVNASQTVTTTSFGGFEPAGTQLTVTPQIANGDHMVLEYTLSLSTFVGESATEGIPPARQQNNLQSIATIPDGFTIILGGFEETTEGEAVSQIPIIGSIPLIGELFKNRSSSESRSRFYAFVTARVLRDDGFESLKYTSDLDLESAGIDDDWPEVRPSIIR